jgi:hypothetical protein
LLYFLVFSSRVQRPRGRRGRRRRTTDRRSTLEKKEAGRLEIKISQGEIVLHEEAEEEEAQ